MRQARRAAARAALVALLAAPTLVLSAGIASAAPGITVDPSGSLAAGTKVTVSATGFTPKTTVVVALCRPDGSGAVTSPLQCADAKTGSSSTASVNADGAFTTAITITVGDIRSGVSCTDTACVIGAISTASTTDQALAPVTLTGAGTTLPAPTSTPTASAAPSATPTPTPSTSASTDAGASATPTPTPEPTTETPTPEPQTTAPATSRGNNGGKPGKLARTGPEDAGLSLVVGLVALQLGLMVAMRTRRVAPAAVTVGRVGRHQR
jgi:hypothetical protein